MGEDPTARARRIWDRHAAGYDRSMKLPERLFLGDSRAWVAGHATGDVLEVAAGTGLNAPFYPSGITLTGVDLSPAMLAHAADRTTALGTNTRLAVADAQGLPFADESFDTVVCTLSFCVIPDDRAAIAEMRRVLRPGGKLILLDHVASHRWPVRAVQRFIEVFSLRFAGEHQTRRPLPLVREAGFAVERAQRLSWGAVERLVAVKPR